MIPFSCSATSGSNAPDELTASAWADDIDAATGGTAAQTTPQLVCRDLGAGDQGCSRRAYHDSRRHGVGLGGVETSSVPLAIIAGG
jgi:hypothetical protein